MSHLAGYFIQVIELKSTILVRRFIHANDAVLMGPWALTVKIQSEYNRFARYFTFCGHAISVLSCASTFIRYSFEMSESIIQGGQLAALKLAKFFKPCEYFRRASQQPAADLLHRH